MVEMVKKIVSGDEFQQGDAAGLGWLMHSQ